MISTDIIFEGKPVTVLLTDDNDPVGGCDDCVYSLNRNCDTHIEDACVTLREKLKIQKDERHYYYVHFGKLKDSTLTKAQSKRNLEKLQIQLRLEQL